MKLFALMDLDGSGTIEFDEFIAVLLTYCMYTKDDILRFCFDTFDKDKSNSIDENEFMALLSTVNNGAPLFPGNMGTALMNFDSNDDGLIDFQEFKVIETRYPMIFFPAFRLQDRMQQKTLGETRWRDLMKSVQKQRFKNEHRRTHGRDPPLTYAETVQKVVCCKRPKEYDIQVIDRKRPSITSAIEAAEKKAMWRAARRSTIVAGRGRLAASIAPTASPSFRGGGGRPRASRVGSKTPPPGSSPGRASRKRRAHDGWVLPPPS